MSDAQQRLRSTLHRVRKIQSERLAADWARLDQSRQTLLEQWRRLRRQRQANQVVVRPGPLAIRELCRADDRQRALDRQLRQLELQIGELGAECARVHQELVEARREVLRLERLAAP